MLAFTCRLHTRAEVRPGWSQELSPGPPREWQSPNYTSHHLRPSRYISRKLETELKPGTPMWNPWSLLLHQTPNVLDVLKCHWDIQLVPSSPSEVSHLFLRNYFFLYFFLSLCFFCPFGSPIGLALLNVLAFSFLFLASGWESSCNFAPLVLLFGNLQSLLVLNVLDF